LERAAEFLANEIKVVQNIDEGKRLVFFVSAKEMLNKTVNPERADSWSQFCDFIELCLNSTEQGCRYVHLLQVRKFQVFSALAPKNQTNKGTFLY
jgi:hypothetical protein